MIRWKEKPTMANTFFARKQQIEVTKSIKNIRYWICLFMMRRNSEDGKWFSIEKTLEKLFCKWKIMEGNIDVNNCRMFQCKISLVFVSNNEQNLQESRTTKNGHFNQP